MRYRSRSETVVAVHVMAVFAASLLAAAPDAAMPPPQAKSAAQSSTEFPRTGIWKLNLQKSQFAPDPGPRSQTRTDTQTSDGLTAVLEGVTGNGAPIAYRYAPRFDGMDYPIVGSGVPSGGETIMVRRVDARTVESVLKKAGVVVLTRQEVVSADGRMLTISSHGTTVAGLPTSNTTVYDKQ